jgi:hypothetical protein
MMREYVTSRLIPVTSAVSPTGNGRYELLGQEIELTRSEFLDGTHSGAVQL